MNRVALERTKAKVYTRTFQSASQPGAGVSRGQNLEKISPKKYFEFNSTSASGKGQKWWPRRPSGRSGNLLAENLADFFIEDKDGLKKQNKDG